MTTLSLFEISELKRMLKEKYRMELHLHDSCAGQSFSFDVVPSQALLRSLDKYLAAKRLRASFGEDGVSFTVEGRF